MKVKRLYIILSVWILVIVNGIAQTQTNKQILAKVLEEKSNTPVPFAFIANSQTGTGKETNNDGVFQMNVSPTDTLLFRCMGYELNSWSLADFNLDTDTLFLTVIARSYALDEINVVQFRSYAAFRSRVANMPIMETGEYKIPFKIDLGWAMSEKKAESGTFGTSLGSIVSLISKNKNDDQKQYANTLAKEKQCALYNQITSRDNLQYITKLEGPKLDSFIVFLRTKHKIDPKLSEYDMLVEVGAAFDYFLAMNTDTISIKH